MSYHNYRQIARLLEQRLPFKGNSMSATIPEGRDRDGDYLSHCGALYSGGGEWFRGRTFNYVVWSRTTPIAGVTVTGEIVILQRKFSQSTTRQQNLCHAYLTGD